MSVLFLDELPLVRLDHFYLRLTDVPFYETGFSNASLVNLTNVNGTNAIIPRPVGTLPLDQFIYYIIGALVLICSLIAIWAIFKAIISPRKYLQSTRSSAITERPPPYKARRAPAPARQSTIVRGELVRHRSEPKYQTTGYAEPSLLAKPNLPLPVVREITTPDNSDDGMPVIDLGAWENLVKEKAKLNITISNLNRIAEARRQAGEPGRVSPRLLAALQKRADVENLINQAYERFKDKKGEWSTAEWEAIEAIMRYSRVTTV